MKSTLKDYKKAKKISKALVDYHQHKLQLRKLRKKDSLTGDAQSIVFHSTSAQDLYTILVTKQFTAGRGGGAMLGPGFYANQHLYQAQKGNYGRFILKASVLNIKQFFFVELNMYKEVVNPSCPDNETMFKEQLEPKMSLPQRELQSLVSLRNSSTSGSQFLLATWPYSSSRTPIWKRAMDLGFRGLVYYGAWDKESIVAWHIEDITPLGVSEDGGQTWKNPKEVAKEFVEARQSQLLLNKDESGKTKQTFERRQVLANKSEEWKRSYVRTLDLKKRYEGKTPDQIKKALLSQLSTIKDPKKKEIRKNVFQDVFTDIDLSD